MDSTSVAPLNVASTRFSDFANPALAEIVETAEVRPVKSVFKSALYEVGSLLVLPVVIAFFIFAMLTFELTVGSFCSQPNISLSNYIAYSLGRVACGSNLFLTPIYGILKVLMITGTYKIAASVFFRARRKAKRYRLSALGNLRKDPRDPVLYLRSFSMEADANPERRSLKTDEEDLALALNYLAPVVAIGAPNDDGVLPMLGATRIYFADDKWQESIERLLVISKLVVIEASVSKGLMWEIGRVVQSLKPLTVLISFLGWKELHHVTRKARYKEFRDRVTQLVVESGESRIVLPEDLGNASFLMFGRDGTPELIDFKSWKRWLFYFSKSILMNEVLRPSFKKRGLYLRRWKTFLYCGYLLSMLFPPIVLLPLILAIYLLNKAGVPNESFIFYLLGGLISLFGLAVLITYVSLLYGLLAKLLIFLANLITGRRTVSVPSILDR